MTTWKVNNITALGGEVCSPWQANHAYSLGARCVCTVAYGTVAARAFVFEVTTAGTSHTSTEPTWPTTPGNTVVDNGVTWTCRQPTTWDNASCFLQYVLNHAAASAGGDIIHVHESHNETGTNFGTFSGASSMTARTMIVCVDKADDSLSVGAIVFPSVAWNEELLFTRHAYSYGVHYKKNGYGATIGQEVNPGTCEHWIFEADDPTTLVMTLGQSIFDPYLYVYGSGSTTYACAGIAEFRNCGISLSGAGAHIRATPYSRFVWENGKLTAANEITRLFNSFMGHFVLRDVDISAMCAGATERGLVGNSDGYLYIPRVELIRCKMPSGAGFVFAKDALPPRRPTGKIRLHHCSSDNATYRFREETAFGYVKEETTIVRTGGASDGTTGIAFKMVSSANVLEKDIADETPPIQGWTGSTTSKTFTIEGIWDSATNIQNDEIWMVLDYPADAASGLGKRASSVCGPLAAAADVGASTETWTTTGLTNPQKFKLSVTVTPGKAGPITARVYLGKPSTTVYIDPKITES